MSIFTLAFWRAAFERATKSAAQGAVLAFGAGQANVLDLDWSVLGGFAGGAFVLSVLTSVGSDALTNGDGPSLTDAEVLTPESKSLVSEVVKLQQITAESSRGIGRQFGEALNKAAGDGATGRGRR